MKPVPFTVEPGKALLAMRGWVAWYVDPISFREDPADRIIVAVARTLWG